jgi:hypothetical protein
VPGGRHAWDNLAAHLGPVDRYNFWAAIMPSLPPVSEFCFGTGMQAYHHCNAFCSGAIYIRDAHRLTQWLGYSELCRIDRMGHIFTPLTPVRIVVQDMKELYAETGSTTFEERNNRAILTNIHTNEVATVPFDRHADITDPILDLKSRYTGPANLMTFPRDENLAPLPKNEVSRDFRNGECGIVAYDHNKFKSWDPWPDALNLELRYEEGMLLDDTDRFEHMMLCIASGKQMNQTRWKQPDTVEDIDSDSDN